MRDPKEVLLKMLDILGEKFGCTTNAEGYKVLDEHVRIIQGDGVSYETIGEILAALKAAGWSAANLGFGSGGALLQRLDRDTQKCAFKCCEIEIGEEHRDVYKNPITDPGKASKKGRLFLHRLNGKLVTVARCGDGSRTIWEDGKATEAPAATEDEDQANDLLVTVFENGELKSEVNFDEVRQRAKLGATREE